MNKLINPRLHDIGISGIREIAQLTASNPNAINMTLGQPDFPTPIHIKEAAKRALDDERTSYTHIQGAIELRRAVSGYMERKYQLSYHPENEVIITAGASQAIDITLRTILEEDTEVIIPTPIFPGYEPVVKLIGATPVHVDTSQHGFKLNAELIEKYITDKTRCIILSYPSNPTGRALNKDELQEIADILKDKHIFVVSDEIYSEIIYDEVHNSIASIKEMRDKTIVINGVSKAFAMTGWRIGFLMGPKEFISEATKVHLYNTTCANSIGQYATITVLTEETADVKRMVSEYRRRRDYIYDRLIRMGMDVHKPEGAFYIFPSIQQTKMDSQQFALRLLKEAEVAVAPGQAFSAAGEGYVRISYACSLEELEKGMDRLEAFLEKIAVTSSRQL